MSTLDESQRPRRGWESPAEKPLDEAVWQAWLAKGRAQDQRSSAALVKSVKWASIVGLLAGAVLWSHVAAYEVVIRFFVAAGAMIAMVQAFQSRHYAFAAAFGALALLYNPAVPAFNLSGGWQRVAVIASVLPFSASLVWGDRRPAYND